MSARHANQDRKQDEIASRRRRDHGDDTVERHVDRYMRMINFRPLASQLPLR
jgi:hypothetical protein